MGHLGLEQAVDGLGGCVVIAVADAADGGLDASFGQPHRCSGCSHIAPPVGMMDEPALPGRPPLAQRLLQGIEHEVRPGMARDTPADDARTCR